MATKYSGSIDDTSIWIISSNTTLAMYMIEEFFYAALDIKN